MAKAKPSLTLVEMESKLGYKIDSLAYPDESVKRFYSDLEPIPSSVYEKTRKEFEEYEKKTYGKRYETVAEKVLPELGGVQTIAHGQDKVTLTRRSHAPFYSLAVDICYGFGFTLPLLFTNNEAFRTISVAKLQPKRTSDVTPKNFELPRELRDKIYNLAIPKGEWKIGNLNDFHNFGFAGGIGDPSGFYFPLSKDLSVLRVGRQIRQEALPVAYRRTLCHLDDMDDLIKLLIAVGKIGRDNIESLEFPWESRTDLECKWEEAPDSEDPFLSLPTLHVEKCVQLLKQCKRLKFLRLYFESELMTNISPDVYKADPGIRGLCSVRGIRRVEIWSMGHEPLDQFGLVRWLKEKMESPEEEEEDENGIGRQDHRQ